MSQLELAKASGLPASSIAHFEGGTRKPSFESLRKIAVALNVTTDYLLGRAKEPNIVKSEDPMYSYGARLTDSDRKLVKDFIDMLESRSNSIEKVNKQ